MKKPPHASQNQRLKAFLADECSISLWEVGDPGRIPWICLAPILQTGECFENTSGAQLKSNDSRQAPSKVSESLARFRASMAQCA
jgi:hypothetical protein